MDQQSRDRLLIGKLVELAATDGPKAAGEKLRDSGFKVIENNELDLLTASMISFLSAALNMSKGVDQGLLSGVMQHFASRQLKADFLERKRSYTNILIENREQQTRMFAVVLAGGARVLPKASKEELKRFCDVYMDVVNLTFLPSFRSIVSSTES